MITFPIDENSSLIVIEPANIAKLKNGEPLKVGEHLVCFTPDLQKFVDALHVPVNIGSVRRDERVEVHTEKITPKQLDAALRACQHLPEVMR